VKRIGVTGGIGSGKSTFCQYLAEFGATVVDMDRLARDILTTDETVRRDVIRTFGAAAYLPDGQPDRIHLAEEAFGKGRIQELNGITHPAVFRRLATERSAAIASGVRLFVIESAILLANGRPKGVDQVVLIQAPIVERERRAALRDQVDAESVRNRIRHQMTDAELRPMCDVIIDNTGDRSILREEAERCFRQWVG
jgi:dephospho-CoA kinase